LLFTKPAQSGTYQGIYIIDGGQTPDSCGYMQFTISGSERSFSGKFISGSTVVKTSGKFSLAHTADVTLPGPNGILVPARLQLLTTNDTPQILGFSTNAGTDVFLLANRLYYSSKLTNSLAGLYTLSLQNTNISQEVPNGDGYASLKISPSGNVSLSGQTADGSKFSQSCGLSRLGDWPLYAAPNKGRGRLLGLLRVNKQTTNSIRGSGIIWLKSAGPDPLYPQGFDLTLEGFGSTFIAPKNQPVVAWTNGIASLHGGDLFSEDVALWDFVQVRLKPPTTFVAEEGTENLKVKASGSKGTVDGSFIDVITGLKAPIKGVVLQQQKTVRGFFISTNSAGSFAIDRR
jgi:hypothetical protein